MLNRKSIYKTSSIFFIFMFVLAGLSPNLAAAASNSGPFKGLSMRDWAQIRNMLPADAVVPSVQQAYVKASNTNASDYFSNVALDGDTLAVGACYEDSSATGVNGNQSNNSAADSGAVYVFTRNVSTWSQQAYLKASNTEAGDGFGCSVAISGDTIVVGAPYEDSNASGVNGDQSDNSATDSGAAYVFFRNGTTWSQQAYLKEFPTSFNGDAYGYSVAISGDTIVVGAYSRDVFDTIIHANVGTAYVYTRSGTTWSDQAALLASNYEANDQFGISVAVSGTTIVVGADDEDSSSTGVNGVQNDNSANNSGAAYVFLFDGSNWNQQAYLKASNTGAGDYFGHQVSISGDTLAVGAYGESSNATGINGDGTNNSASASGAVYVFTRSGTAWSQQAYVKASNTDAIDYFGNSVSVDGDMLVVGAINESSSAAGLNGNQADNSAGQSGAAYLFTRSGTTWTQQTYLKASNTEGGDNFGNSVGVSGSTIAVGAWLESSNATGINGNQANNDATNSGAVYVFAPPPPPMIVEGNSVSIANGDTTPSTTDLTDFGSAAVGSGSVSNTFTIQNLGVTNLILTGSPKVAVSGQGAADFTVTLNPSSPVGVGGSTTFTVRFKPSVPANHTATISIANNTADENPFTFTIKGIGTGTEINIKGAGHSIADGDTTPSSTDGTDFGTQILKKKTSHIFTIQNLGNTNLNLTGTPKVSVSGPGAADFIITAFPNSPVVPSGSTTFTVGFSPIGGGLRKAILSIANSDANENPYTFAIQGTGDAPEINVKGKGVTISNGDVTPSLADNTDYGFVTAENGTVDHTFTIENLGTKPLNLTGTPKVMLVKVNNNSADFFIVSQPAGTIAPGGSTSFTLEFKASTLDAIMHQAEVSIPSTDSSENPYTFRVQGFSGKGPIMVVKTSSGVIIKDSGNSRNPSRFEFGLANINGGTQGETFTILNHGNAALNLTGTPKVKIIGTNANDFTVVTQPTSPVPPGSSTTFTLRFNPSVLGGRQATVVIVNNDAQYSTMKGNYGFDVFGLGAQEHLRNGGMENGTSIPQYWTAASFTGSDGRDTTVKQQGSASVKITGTNVQKTLTQTVSLSGSQNDPINLSYWVKGQSITAGTCSAQAVLYNGAAVVHTFTRNCPAGTYAFQQESLVFNASVTFDSVKVILTYSDASGTVWFDSVSLLK